MFKIIFLKNLLNFRIYDNDANQQIFAISQTICYLDKRSINMIISLINIFLCVDDIDLFYK